MSSQKIEHLTALLSKLPGIGPRQAARLVFHLLDEKNEFRTALTESIISLCSVRRCAYCFQAFENGGGALCGLCNNGTRRDKTKLMVVEKDTDFSNIEKTGLYEGLYFILGGVISPFRPDAAERLRFRELFRRIEHDTAIEEVILATSVTPEGDHTARYIEKIVEPVLKTRKEMRLSRLARGLSTGSELEYSDPETFKNAYFNRK